MDLSVCIIAKNEERNLYNCLEALKVLDCELIFVDTGSSDSTISIAREYTDKIWKYEWQGDFADVRNYAADLAGNDLILAVDCDEFLREADLVRLEKLAKENTGALGMITRLSPFGNETDAMIHHEHVARLYDRREYRWKGRVHENLTAVTCGKDNIYYDIPLVFFHNGYENREKRRGKARKYLELLKLQIEETGDDPYVLFQMGQCYVALDDKEKAVEMFDRALSMDIDPRLNYVRDMMDAYGYALLDLKRYKEALGLEAVYDSFYDRADYLFLMGLIYMNNAMFDKAIASFDKATKTSLFSVEGVNSFMARYNIGVIHEVLGNIAGARQMYLACGDYLPALKRLAEIQ